MRTASRVRVIAWGTVFLILLSVLISGLNNNWNWGKFNFSFGGFSYTYDNANRYTAGNGEVPASSVEHLKVDWTAGSVKVIEGNTDTIAFFEDDNITKEEDRLHYYLEGNTLRIKYQSSRRWQRQEFKDKKNLTVQIPKGKQLQSADLDIVSSEMHVETLSARDVDIENVSGKLTLNNIIADKMEVETVSGGMEGTNLKVVDLQTHAVSGKTTMSGEFIEVKSETVSGGIELTPGAKVQKLDTDGVSGGVKVYLPENNGFTVKYDKVSGGFHCDFPTTVSEKDKYVYKNGEARFDFQTVSGGINIIKIG